MALAVAILALAITLNAANTTVADAAKSGDAAAVKALLKQGADVNAAQGDGMTALHWAATNGDVAMTQMLLSAGANVRGTTRLGGLTALHLATQAGQAQVAAALIAAADHGLRVYEYSPKKVKMAVVGKGTADKIQVAFMVRALLGLSETPPPDAADALAIGLAHLQASDPLKAKLLDRRLV